VDNKFRAWIYDEKRMIYEIGILESTIIEYSLDKVYRKITNHGTFYYNSGNPADQDYDRLCIPAMPKMEYGKSLVEIMKYTGLKDKNGKEIYENDIIRLRKNTRHFDKTIYPIIHLGYAFQMYDGAILNPVSIDYYDIIKIRNIYENPELMGVINK